MIIEDLIQVNESVLKAQSRSFAIPILALAPNFKLPIMVEYNLNKLFDTIEDSIKLDNSTKQSYLMSVLDSLNNNTYIDPSILGHLLSITPEEEKYVFKYATEIFDLFYSADNDTKALCRKFCDLMAKGMSLSLSSNIENINDLNDYCYIVAGSVGEFLTELLFMKGHNISDAQKPEMLVLSKKFGFFLQKLNIIRDFNDDNSERERCFWPDSILSLPTSDTAKLNLMCYFTWLNDIPDAIKYHDSIPEGNETFEYFIRFILKSGLEYLKLMVGNKTIFSTLRVKLSKAFVSTLYTNVSKQSKSEFHAYCENAYQSLGNKIEATLETTNAKNLLAHQNMAL